MSVDWLGSTILNVNYITLRPHLACTAKDVVVFYSVGLFNSVTNLGKASFHLYLTKAKPVILLSLRNKKNY